MTAWNLVVLPALSACIGLIELDVALVGQWMLGRPIVVGPLTGLACGRLGIGLAMGALVEFFTIETPPMGSVIPINGAVAAGCAVLLAAGARPVPVEAAFPAGLACGLVYGRIEGGIRDWRSALTADAAEGLQREGEIDWVWLLVKSLGVQALVTAAFVYAAVAVSAPLLSWVWGVLPRFVIDGAETAFSWSPWLGLGAVIHALARKA